jgi:hypothetical protein
MSTRILASSVSLCPRESTMYGAKSEVSKCWKLNEEGSKIFKVHGHPSNAVRLQLQELHTELANGRWRKWSSTRGGEEGRNPRAQQSDHTFKSRVASLEVEFLVEVISGISWKLELSYNITDQWRGKKEKCSIDKSKRDSWDRGHEAEIIAGERPLGIEIPLKWEKRETIKPKLNCRNSKALKLIQVTQSFDIFLILHGGYNRMMHIEVST